MYIARTAARINDRLKGIFMMYLENISLALEDKKELGMQLGCSE
jgi:hypothetical protein